LSQSMRVIICTDGPEEPKSKQNWALGAHLAALKHDVCLVTEGRRRDLVGNWKGCRVETWPSRRPSGIRDGVFFWRLLRTFRPDVVTTNFFSFYLGISISFLQRIPCRVAWYRGLLEQSDLDFPKSKPKRMLKLAINRRLFRMATHHAPVSPAGLDDLIRHYGVSPDKCRIFHTCRADPQMVEACRVKPPTAYRHVVFVGRLHYSKGQDILLHALKKLGDAWPDLPVKVTLVGGGPEEANYRRLARELGVDEQVYFTGRIPNSEVFHHLEAAHLMVVPVRSEIGPGVIPEALGMGLPVVVSSCGGMPSLLGDSPAVQFVPPVDADALADAIGEILSDEPRRLAMAAEARRLFLAKFNLDHWINGVADWLVEISEASRRPGLVKSRAIPVAP
jgi:glycosyltransferase involved in cell wall biosynthesis